MRCFIYSFLVYVFLSNHLLPAQTMDSDTLAKYHITKINTYRIDSSGQKKLEKVELANKQGLIVARYHDLGYSIDSIRYEYGEDGEIIKEYHKGKRFVNRGEKINEKIKDYEYVKTYEYIRNGYLTRSSSGAFSKTIYKDAAKRSYIKKGSLNGKRDFVTRVKKRGNVEFLLEKHYQPAFKRYRKNAFRIKTYFDSKGLWVKIEWTTKRHFRNFFIRRTKASTCKNAERFYEGSFIVRMKTHSSGGGVLRKKTFRYVLEGEPKDISDEYVFEYIRE